MTRPEHSFPLRPIHLILAGAVAVNVAVWLEPSATMPGALAANGCSVLLGGLVWQLIKWGAP